MTLVDYEYYLWVLLLCIAIISSLQKKRRLHSSQIISKDTSVTLKAICCIVIVLHHYGLRVSNGLVSRVLAIGGGTLALTIFLCLSAYGIAMSEKSKGTGIKSFLNKRLSKVLIPYVVIMVFTYIAYWFIGGQASLDEMIANRINPSFAFIGNHESTWIDFFRFLFGVESLCGSMWFVGVTVYTYLAFLISKSCFSMKKEQRKLFTLYSVLIVIFGIVAYLTKAPGHYYRNLWALVLGLHFALYQEWWMKLSKYRLFLTYIGLNVLLTTYLSCFHELNPFYLFFANMGIMGIFIINKLFEYYQVKKHSVISWLAILSYMVYLTHGKLLVIQWWYMGYTSISIVIIGSLLIAYLYFLTEKLIKK